MTNAEAVPVAIDRVLVGCGCLSVAEIDRRTLAPGERLPITIRYDMSVVRPTATKAEYMITVLTDRADRPPLQVPVTYEYVPAMHALQPELRFKVRRGGDGGYVGDARSSARIFCTDKRALRNLSAEASAPYLRASISEYLGDVELAPDLHVLDLSVSLLPGISPGVHRSSVTVRAHGVGPQEVTIPVKVTVGGPVDVIPPTIVVRGLRPGEVMERRIRLRGTGPNLRVGSATCSDPRVRAKVVRLSESESEIIVAMAISPDHPKGEANRQFAATLRVEIESPEKYTEEIAIWGDVRLEER